MNEILVPNARLYASRHQLDIAEALGSGKEGIDNAMTRASAVEKIHAFASHHH